MTHSHSYAHRFNNINHSLDSADILIVEDDADLREAICDTCEISGYSVVSADSGEAALARLNEYQFKLVISDIQMKPMDGAALLENIKQHYEDLPVIIMTAYASIEKAVDVMRLGASDYLVKPFEANVLQRLIEKFMLAADIMQPESELIAEDEKMKSLKLLASKVAQSDATVLLYGESGVGKEVFSQFIHHQSKRSDQAFVAINCAAIPENMLEAVLFGYEKGAFTGAHQATPGKFEMAQDGTLLLDEISEMDSALQAKLLRVLQEKEVERLGGRKTIKLNVRVIATTNRNLKQEVSAGRFREDLFYRLSVFPIQIPALRERISDIVPLATRLLNRHAGIADETFQLSADAQQKLLNYEWKGNVRELDNVMQRAIIFKNGNEITSDEIHLETDDYHELHGGDVEDAASELMHGLKDREQQLIIEALKAGNGSRKYAAERLGISPRTLRYKLARMRDAGITV